MPREALIDRIIELIGDTPHLPDELKEEILGNLDGLDDEVLQEMIDVMTESNERLAHEYEKVNSALFALAGKAEKIAEGEKKTGEQSEIEKIRSSLKE